MDKDYDVIDDCGDLLIILTPATEPFAPWDDSAEEEDSNEEVLKELENVREELKALRTKAEEHTKAEGENEVDKEDPDAKIPEYKAIVSSAILRRASPVLRKDLDPKGPWKQSEVQPDGLRHKRLEGFDAAALQHVLNVIHLRNHKVPHALSLEDLAKVAVVVDYFQCGEAFDFVTNMWIKPDIEEMDTHISRSLILWLLVSTVFKVDAIFMEIAPVIIMQGKRPFDSLGLPIAADVVGFLDTKRKHQIGSLLVGLGRMRDQILQGSSKSEEYCMWHLGVLQKCLWDAGLWFFPNEPYDGISVVGVNAMLEKYRTLAFDAKMVDFNRCYYSIHDFGISKLLEESRKPVKVHLISCGLLSK